LRSNKTYKNKGKRKSRDNVIAFGTVQIPVIKLDFSSITDTDTTVGDVPTLFTRIIAREIPGHFVYQDNLCVAFLTINPIATGHTLVVPIEEVDQWTDLSQHTSSHLLAIATKIGNAQKQVYGSTRIGLIIAGFEIPHCHLHVIPTNSMSDLSFEHAASYVNESVLHAEAEKLSAAVKTI
jgi:diadenosine tetraphosphate (Ap4A) HIT family hydrolase